MRPGLLSLPLLLGACSFSTYDYTECTDNAACRDAFGWGYACGAEGFCEVITPIDRCQQSWPEGFWQDPGAFANSIVLGVNYDYVYTIDVQSMRLAINQVNEAGSLESYDSYVLLECNDTESDQFDDLGGEEAAAQIADFLAGTVGVPAIIGADYSATTQAAFAAAEPWGTLLMSPAASSPALTELDVLVSTDEDPGLLWRTVPPDSLQGKVIAQYMVDPLEVKKTAVIYETGFYGEGLEEAFYESFVGADRTVELLPFSTEGERAEAIGQLESLGVEQVLYIASDRDSIVAFLNSAAQMDIFTRTDPTPAGIFLTDAAYYIDIFEEVAANAAGLFPLIHGSRPAFTTGGVYDSYAAAYSGAFAGEDPGESAYGAYSFDATWLVLYGTAWSLYNEGSITGLGIARGMRRVSAGDSVDVKPSEWPSVKSHFAEGIAVNVNGTSGDLDMDPNTGETEGPIEVWGIGSDGGSGWAFTALETVQP